MREEKRGGLSFEYMKHLTAKHQILKYKFKVCLTLHLCKWKLQKNAKSDRR